MMHGSNKCQIKTLRNYVAFLSPIHHENKNKNIRSIPSIEIFLLFEEWNVAC